MTAVIEGYSTFYTDAAWGPLTLSRPAGTVDGELLLAVCAGQVAGGTFTESGTSDWTLVDSGNSHINLFVFKHIAASGDPSTWTFGFNRGQESHGTILRISGHNNIDVAADQGNNSSATWTCADITTTVDDCLVIRVAAGGVSTTKNDLTGGTTTVKSASGGSNTVCIGYDTQVTAGATGTDTWTGGTGAPSQGMSIAVRPASGATYSINGQIDITLTMDITTSDVTDDSGLMTNRATSTALCGAL